MKPTITGALAKTRDYYAQHFMLGSFYKKYICSECKYCEACAGANTQARMKCSSYKEKPITEPAKWNEMSYNRFAKYSNLSERMRRERREDWK